MSFPCTTANIMAIVATAVSRGEGVRNRISPEILPLGKAMPPFLPNTTKSPFPRIPACRIGLMLQLGRAHYATAF